MKRSDVFSSLKVAFDQSPACVLQGPSGCGKSYLAAMFSKYLVGHYKVIAWIAADSEMILLEEYRTLADSTHFTGNYAIKASTLNELTMLMTDLSCKSSTRDFDYIILDNVTNFDDIILLSHFHIEHGTKILVTTQIPEYEVEVEYFKFIDMTFPSAEEYLEYLSDYPTASRMFKDEEYHQLLASFNAPQQIHDAARYLSKNRILNPNLEKEILPDLGINFGDLQLPSPPPGPEKDSSSSSSSPCQSFLYPQIIQGELSEYAITPLINEGSSSFLASPSISSPHSNESGSIIMPEIPLQRVTSYAYLSDYIGPKYVPRMIDLVFLVDCTESMTTLIETVRAEVKNILKSLMEEVFLETVNLAFVGYRDFCDGEDNYVIQDFTSDLSEVHNFIDNIEAKGGIENVADIAGGYFKALYSLSWTRVSQKLIIHFANSAAHGSGWNSGLPDPYNNATLIPDPECRPDKMKEYVMIMYEKTMYLIFVQLDRPGSSRTQETFDNLKYLFCRMDVGHRINSCTIPINLESCFPIPIPIPLDDIDDDRVPRDSMEHVRRLRRYQHLRRLGPFQLF
ncbi:hypothetical protein HK098_002290 [Nowakowskiella sp. JEL0407]|nr:hypothetical protein HK098_002290 [Nowakowskiella sp. JEL0407]